MEVGKRFDHGFCIERIVEWIEGRFLREDISLFDQGRRRRFEKSFVIRARIMIHDMRDR